MTVDVTIFGPDRGTLTVQLMEVYGSTTLPSANASYSPTVYDGFPDLEWDINWVEPPSMSSTKPAKVKPSGRYQVAEILTDKTQTTLRFLVSAMTRSATWELRGKINYMKGRYVVFWVKAILNIIAVGATQSSTEISISTASSDIAVDKIHGVYIENAAGASEFLTGNMVKTLGVWEFVYNNTSTVTNATIIKQAYLMRSVKDAFTMTWYSFSCADMPLDLIEVTEAYDV